MAGALTQTGAIDANSTMTLSGTLTMDGTNNAIIPAAAPSTPLPTDCTETIYVRDGDKSLSLAVPPPSMLITTSPASQTAEWAN
jgi:hypothetical protein